MAQSRVKFLLKFVNLFLLVIFFVFLNLKPVFGDEASCISGVDQGESRCVTSCKDFPDRSVCEDSCHTDAEAARKACAGGTTPGLLKAKQSLGKVGEGIGQTASLESVIGGIIQGALALVGVIFLALTVYGGYLWMLAREDEAQAEKAMQIIKMAVIGLAVVLAAYAITFFVVSRLTGATTALPSQ